jgi:hypothetical protein
MDRISLKNKYKILIIELKNTDKYYFMKIDLDFITTKNITLTFVATFKIQGMFEFSQYLGFTFFIDLTWDFGNVFFS